MNEEQQLNDYLYLHFDEDEQSYNIWFETLMIIGAGKSKAEALQSAKNLCIDILTDICKIEKEQQ